MKRSKHVILMSVLFCVIRMNAQQIVLQNADITTDTLELVFNDDFEGSALNTSVWNVVEGVLRDPEGKRDTLLGKKFEVWLGDGMKPFVNDFYFTTAEIQTIQQFGYGMYEIRCKVPAGCDANE